jgi:hypothetical protein
MMAGAGSFTRDRVVSISFHTPYPAEAGREIRIRWLRLKLRRPAA